ncbi:alpha/beta hydrolase [Rhodococcus sp. IEGM 1409]|uniref:alpha/beta hydrolase family protein n=1 Tax=Rhodococcus sp. IEGM 1409 TaxID=3047082 RepID=UPI0024B8473E|nr:alpha/beta hydrolase [Rhodococcus sp. IEGM 1409]MDI9898828.1 alpha/beta hydrolase [Rhodococcus sp. IEGM 1409]
MKSKSFVLTVPEVDREQHAFIDVYRDHGVDDGHRRPLIIFVHGGPLPPNMQPAPRDWPAFVGYGSLAANEGAVGVTLEHHMHSLADCAATVEEISTAIEQARSLPDVDPDKVALWFFSGSGILVSDWLRDPPSWLTCVALTYPVLDFLPEWEVDSRFHPITALEAHSAGSLPILLTRVGIEKPEFAAGVEAFAAAANSNGIGLDIIDVPDGRHGFDMLEATDASRAAVTEAMDWVVGNLV